MCRRIHAPLVVTAAVQPGVSARLGSSERWRSAVPGHDEAVAASLKRPELSVDGGQRANRRSPRTRQERHLTGAQHSPLLHAAAHCRDVFSHLCFGWLSGNIRLTMSSST